MSARPTRAMTTEQTNDALTVIGIDFSKDPKKVGIALGVIDHDGPRVESALLGKAMQWDDIVNYAVTLIGNAEGASTLIALDAPLGWPQGLWKELSNHHAGAVLRIHADEMFHRLTDDVVKKKLALKQNPMEVGADKIARTAHHALWFLDQVRERTGLRVPLSWTPGRVSGVEAIEVYPAATLAGRGLPTMGYKTGVEAPVNRRDLVSKLARIVDLGPHEKELGENDNLLDAVLCVVAGFDFAAGDVLRPSNEASEQARREGWIWVRLQRPDPDLSHVLR
ncbi:MAG: DUF429 domain-containing protein [Acidimicrobiaceae bacterium]|nr:DUF429 domain-containing protein [Acidimicrobiaceae bacterium]MYE09335.1 DUF429 domain-containing protein [Acidimicrobiaceae bacterium]MYI35342.1 DUF429 domain-containing protein [Acidimicrobiaceae bacterium]